MQTSLCQAQLLPPGARAQGMGGAYTAVADDVTAAYWNPAGLTALHHFHMDLAGAQVQTLGGAKLSDLTSHIPDDNAGRIALAKRLGQQVTGVEGSGDVGLGFHGFALMAMPFVKGSITPRDPGGNIGLKYTPGFPDIPLPGSSSEFAGAGGAQIFLSGAHQVQKKTSVGLSLKIVGSAFIDTKLTWQPTPSDLGATTTTSANSPTTTGFGVDVGALHQASREVTLGLTLRNLIAPHTVGFTLPTTATFGAAWRPKRNLLVAADLADIGSRAALNIGAELKLTPGVALRGGLYRGRPTLGLGLGNAVNVAYGLNETMLSFGIGF